MTRFTRTLTLVLCCATLSAGLLAHQAQTGSASLLMQQAHQKATLEADLPGAIALYKEVVTRFGRTDRASAATATFRIAECYEKLGDPQAETYFQQIVTAYSDYGELAKAARQRLSSGTPTLICEQCGDIYGAVSPDGQVMATVIPFFGGEHTGAIGMLDLRTQKLSRVDVEGSGANATGAALSPRFSPDMQRLAYLWANSTTKRGELRVTARSASSKATVLVNNPEIPYIEPHGWSVDGRILVLLQRPDRTWEIATVSAANGSITRVKSLDWRIAAPQHETSFSPDGRFIAYAALTTNPAAPIPARQGGAAERQIYIVAADGSTEAAITTGAGSKRQPVWTPDGSHIIYLSNVSGSWDIWAAPVRAGKPAGAPVLVRSDVGSNVISLGLSRDGRYHYYEAKSGVFRTTVATVRGAGSKGGEFVTSFPGALPSWSPDGSTIAVTRPSASGAPTILLRNVNTGEERVITSPPLANFPFSWSGDGSRLLIVASESGRQHWYTVDVGSGKIERRAPVGAEEFQTHANVRAWAPDGRSVYLGTWLNATAQLINRVVALDLDSGVHREVFTLPGDAESWPRAAQDIALATSPDGRSLAILHRDRKLDRFRLATVGIDGNGYRELLPPFEARAIRTKLAWTRGGSIVFPIIVGGSAGVTSADTDVHRLMRIPAAGGQAEPVGLEITALERFDVSPDGTEIAYSLLTPEGAGQLVWGLNVSQFLKNRR